MERRRAGGGRRGRRVPWPVIAVFGGLVAAAVSLGTAGHSSPHQPVADAAVAALPTPVKPAFVPGPPRSIPRHRAYWAAVRRPADARSGPSASASVVAAVPATTPEGTRNIVAVIGHREDATGSPWVQVRLAALPNGTTGWVPRRALGGYGATDTELVVDLHRLQATLYRSGHVVLRAPVGVGAAGWPTPRGEFYVRNRLTRYRSPAYGPVAFGTSARSERATDWPAGGYVGIHGTDRPDLVPGRVSHGCIRMRNPDVLALARRMPVGTPVTIR